jgi:nucleotide-binding universal stress UspA family protein
MQASVRRDLDALLSDEDRQQLGAKAVVVTSTMPAQAIVQYANETKANLIVLGTHGRNTVARFFIGSVAERVVRTASCPVLTVRESEREFVLPDALQRVAHA